MGNGLYYAVLLKNIAVVCVFARLAIYFEKWWIVLFAALLTSSIETNE